MKNILLFWIILGANLAYTQEVCNNGIDDDGDDLIDLNDSDCDCEGFPREIESLIPNPSFEDMDCCPETWSQLRCASTWQQASSATSDYYNLCGITDIGYMPAELPLPGGGAGWVGFYNTGDYKEYIGACLDRPLLAGVNYTLNFYTAWSSGLEEFEIGLFGTPNCAELPWMGYFCPEGIDMWELLTSVSVTYEPDGSWIEVTVDFTPTVDINAIAIGGSCEDAVMWTSYYYLDELTLIDSESFSDISKIGDWCEGEMLLEASTDTSGGEWQWYKDGIALVGETSERIDITPYGLGDFSAVYVIGDNCQRSNITVALPDAFEVDFDFGIVCLGSETNFENLTDVPGGTTWNWDFGDETTSTLKDPTHAYGDTGTFIVTLSAENEIFCGNEITKEVLVEAIPVPKFEFIIDGLSSEDGSLGGCIINPVQFNDLSTIHPPGEITGWNWIFGDGGTSSLENPEHTYGAEGIYPVKLTVTTASGCSATFTLDIVMSESVSIDIIANDPTCYGFSDGSIILNIISGGEDGVLFELKDAEGNVLNVDNSNAANSLNAGTYSYSIEDGTTCGGFGTITLGEPEQLDIDIVTVNPECYGYKTGWAKVDEVFNATGDYDAISYIWNPNPAGISGIGADSTWNLGAGEYTLTINDENGCSDVFDFVIGQPDSLEIVQFEYEPAYCRLHEYQSGNGVVKVAVIGGTGDASYLWTHLETGETSNFSTWGGRNPGVYQMVATDKNGCTLTSNITVDSLNPKADFEITSDQFTSNYKGTADIDAHFVNLSENFANPFNPLADTTFFWNFDRKNTNTWILSEDLYETFDTIYKIRGESYEIEVCLVAINKNGCTDTLCKNIIIYEPIQFDQVNVFSPNEDGINDLFTFQFKAKSISEFHCVIVDRWGITKTELNHITEGWDGTDMSGSKCSDGVYFYTYEAITDNGSEIVGQGTIQLVDGK